MTASIYCAAHTHAHMCACVCICVCCSVVSDSLWPHGLYKFHEILQAKVMKWVAICFSRGSSQPRHRTQVSHIAGDFFTIWATREARCWLRRHRHYRKEGQINRKIKCGLLDCAPGTLETQVLNEIQIRQLERSPEIQDRINELTPGDVASNFLKVTLNHI